MTSYGGALGKEWTWLPHFIIPWMWPYQREALELFSFTMTCQCYTYIWEINATFEPFYSESVLSQQHIGKVSPQGDPDPYSLNVENASCRTVANASCLNFQHWMLSMSRCKQRFSLGLSRLQAYTDQIKSKGDCKGKEAVTRTWITGLVNCTLMKEKAWVLLQWEWERYAGEPWLDWDSSGKVWTI